MSASKIIAVTGATGFLGSHVAGQLLDEGYTVRLVARGQKAERLREALGIYGDRVEVVSVADISSGDFKTAFEGAWAVIHVASPLPAKGDSQTMIKSAVDGTINVLAQTVKYGVQKVVVTGSVVALKNPGDSAGWWSDGKWDESDWGVVKQEDVTDDKLDPFAVYEATKILSEKALWKFAEEHKEIDIATILPPFIFGPFRPDFPPPASIPDISTDSMILQLITGSPDRAFPHQISASYIDVRDVARAHVRALTVPPADQAQTKRYIVEGGSFTWKDAIELIAQKRPELKEALPDVGKAPPKRPVTVAVAERARVALGMDEYVPWQKTVLDAVDDLVKVRSSWE